MKMIKSVNFIRNLLHGKKCKNFYSPLPRKLIFRSFLEKMHKFEVMSDSWQRGQFRLLDACIKPFTLGLQIADLPFRSIASERDLHKSLFKRCRKNDERDKIRTIIEIFVHLDISLDSCLNTVHTTSRCISLVIHI